MKRGSILCAVLFLLALTAKAQDTALLRGAKLVAQHPVSRSTVSYPVGAHFIVRYHDERGAHRVKGYFAGMQGTKLAVSKRRRGDVTELIHVDSIRLLRRIHPTRNLVFAAGSFAMITGAALIIDKATQGPRGTMQVILAIPFIGIGTYLLVAIPVTALIDLVSEKRSVKGWHFRLLPDQKK